MPLEGFEVLVGGRKQDKAGALGKGAVSVLFSRDPQCKAPPLHPADTKQSSTTPSHPTDAKHSSTAQESKLN
jgi:hypothetical protein